MKQIAKNEEIFVENGNDFVFVSNYDDKNENDNEITSSKQKSQEI